MEKEQPDSLATVAVVAEKMPQTHSHYAPSEVYSSAEPPPAYMRPPTKSTAVQIARIAAITLITISIVLGSFILAASWVQARASCTPQSIAAMQAKLKEEQASTVYQQEQQQQGELFKHLRAEALVQNAVDSKQNLQSLLESTKKEADPDTTKSTKLQKEEESTPKSDNESGDRDDDEDDYDDDEFTPVHIKLPLQLNFDDIAGALMQQARSRVSCVVERRRADEVMDGSNDNALNNNTDSQRFQRLSGERVAILCESGNNANQEQQNQEMLTPLIIPLGTVQIPVQQQEPNTNYQQYQIHTQYQVPDMQQLPLSDPRGLNHIPTGSLPSEFRNLPQLNVEMRPPRMGAQLTMQAQPTGPQLEMRRIPLEIRHFPIDSARNVKHPMQQEHNQEPLSVMYQPTEQNLLAYNNEQQGVALVPPPPPPPPSAQADQQIHEQRMVAEMPQAEQPQIDVETAHSSFQGIPLEIRRIIQQVPLEIKNIIQHITGESRPFSAQAPEVTRRENMQVPLRPFPFPLEVKNLLEHGKDVNDEVLTATWKGRQREDSSEEQEAKSFPESDNETDELERNFPVPVEIRNIIHQVVEGRAFPVPRFPLPLRPVESLEVPVETHAEISDVQNEDQTLERRQEQTKEQSLRTMLQQQPEHQPQVQQRMQEEQGNENRPHYVQPRSVRSVPEAFAHRREKRVRRCACDCAC